LALMFLTGDGMRDGPLHHHISGAPLIGERRTAPRYRFYSIRDEFPALCPVGEGGGAILGELYDVPMSQLRDLLAREPPELELSIVELAAGRPRPASPRAWSSRSPWCCGAASANAAGTPTSRATGAGGPTAGRSDTGQPGPGGGTPGGSPAPTPRAAIDGLPCGCILHGIAPGTRRGHHRPAGHR
jgi:hypothetical protein